MIITEIKYLADCKEHIPTLAQWFHDAWGYLDEESSVERGIKKLKECLSYDKIPLTIVAEKDSELLGSASIVEYDMDTHKHLSPWLASVYVKSEHRRNGIGTILVKRMIEESKKLGIKKFYLFTPDMNRFYDKIGWKTIEEPEYKNQKVYVMQYTNE